MVEHSGGGASGEGCDGGKHKRLRRKIRTVLLLIGILVKERDLRKLG